MKFDMTTAIITAIVGVVVAYIVAGNIIGGSESINIKSLSSPVNTSLADPSPEIFNYRALNPTVEAYVGNDCQNYDSVNGVCLDDNPEENPENNNPEEE